MKNSSFQVNILFRKLVFATMSFFLINVVFWCCITKGIDLWNICVTRWTSIFQMTNNTGCYKIMPEAERHSECKLDPWICTERSVKVNWCGFLFHITMMRFKKPALVEFGCSHQRRIRRITRNDYWNAASFSHCASVWIQTFLTYFKQNNSAADWNGSDRRVQLSSAEPRPEETCKKVRRCDFSH